MQAPGAKIRLVTLLLAVVLGTPLGAGQTLADTQEFDLVLLGGTVVDGTGAPPRRADVGFRDGHIAAIGDLGTASGAERLAVAGKVVAPGFIDVHSHADRAFADEQAAAMEGFLRQGVTTTVFGVDGYQGLEDLKETAARAAAGQSGLNFLSYIGHNAVRASVMGNAQRAPTEAELDQMKAQVREAMEFGAVGLSSGLMYLPGRYADQAELIALARVVAPYGGRYDSHVRDPANNLIASHRECLETGAAAGVHAHPAHMKAVGGKNFGSAEALVELVNDFRRAGHEVTVDVYPYDGAATAPVVNLLYPGTDPAGEALMQRLDPLLSGKSIPAESIAQLLTDLRSYWRESADNPQALATARARTEDPPAGVFSWIATVGYASLRIVVSAEGSYEGRLVTELAAEQGIGPFELLRRIVVAEGTDAMVTLGAILEEDVRRVLSQPWAMVASDGEELAPSHPRGRGTFARLLGRYVREWQVLSLEEAVYKVTGLPASYLRLENRGVLREGAVADVVVFDPGEIIDRATWAQPQRYATGVSHVFIRGRPAIADGVLQPQRLGRYLPFKGDSMTGAGTIPSP
ncbi:amidohydrolase family protein [Pseudohaliea sp.]|uniref:N-acyl-D-amino-acid deacylase family protein n=1 Tax=Pseudohaliea sp. TaxID=2740289 RepID=UPI0032EC93A0